MKRIVLLILLLAELCCASLAQSQEETFGLRLIAVRTEAEALRLRSEIQAGDSFEALAETSSTDPSAGDGGYLGLLRITDLRPEFQKALEGLAPGRISAVTPVDGDFVLLQRLGREEVDWVVSNRSGIKAFEQGRYEEAAQSFRQAVEYAEKLTPTDHRLADSLHGLAETYRLQKKYSDAEPLYLRYLALQWGGSSTPQVLERFSALLAQAYFRDSQFDEALRKYTEAVNQAPVSEDLYQAMGAILFKAQLKPEAEALMLRAAQLFPASRDVRFHLAQLYLSSAKPKRALEVFDQLSGMKAPAGIDPALDRLQQSVVYQKIGSIQSELVEFEAAAVRIQEGAGTHARQRGIAPGSG